jgi:hypothetical protein
MAATVLTIRNHKQVIPVLALSWLQVVDMLLKYVTTVQLS